MGKSFLGKRHLGVFRGKIVRGNVVWKMGNWGIAVVPLFQFFSFSALMPTPESNRSAKKRRAAATKRESAENNDSGKKRGAAEALMNK
jgi:hypothetical protein